MQDIEVLKLDEKPKKKLKKWVKILIGIISFLIILLVSLFIIFSFLLSPVSSSSKIAEFTVEEGSSVYSVGKRLEKQGVIRNFMAYKIMVKVKNINGYKAGVYKLDKSYSTTNIINLLNGNYYKNSGITITFKEGKTVRNIAKAVAKNTDITESEFYLAMQDETYINTLIDKYWFLTDDIKSKDVYYPLEGYLFPDTYTFSKDVSAKDIIETMLKQSNKVFSKYKSLVDSNSYAVHELSSLASMVESEGIYSDDRMGIAGVFYNRLNTGMSLGSDVTTYYAFKVDLGERDLTAAEINTYNAYNTRGPKMAGKLPVGPISNFSESSFKAVLKPAKSEYYYFVADKSGKTHFTKTYEEHQELIKELKEAGNWIEW